MICDQERFAGWISKGRSTGTGYIGIQDLLMNKMISEVIRERKVRSSKNNGTILTPDKRKSNIM